MIKCMIDVKRISYKNNLCRTGLAIISIECYPEPEPQQVHPPEPGVPATRGPLPASPTDTLLFSLPRT